VGCSLNFGGIDWEKLGVEITVAITGASGAVYPYRFLNHLAAEPAISRIHVVASASGIRVLNEELELRT